MHTAIPILGRFLTGANDANKYLPDTTENFVTAEMIANLMAMAGFKNIRFERKMFGTITFHWAEK